MTTRTLLAALLLAFAPFEGASAQGLIPIGAAGGVAGRVTALAPQAGAVGRVLSSGKTVYHKDTISTDAGGRLQIMLLDQSVFTIGPNSEMFVDEFVYDPDSAAGKVAVRVTKGAFRFVTGKVARKNPAAMKVALPTGTIGIRGTIAAGRINADGSILVALLGPGAQNTAGERPGAVEVTDNGETVVLLQPGFATILRAGQAPLPPFQLTPDQFQSLEVKPEARSGGGEPPTTERDAAAVGDLGKTTKVSDVVLGEKAHEGGLNQFTLLASQDLSFDDPTIINWDEFLTHAPTGGSGTYSGSGSYTCSGGVCGSGGSGNWTIHFQVDWANRTLGGGGSSSHIAFQSGSGGPLCPGGCSSEYDSQIPATSFSALAGDAKLVQGQDFTGTNTEFNGSSFQFNNQPATFTGNLVYNGQGSSANATFTGGNCSGTCPN